MIQTAALKLEQYTRISNNDKTPQILHALLEHAPIQGGRDNVAEEITSCIDDAALRQLSIRYLTGLLTPMRAQGGKTPPITEHPRPSAVMNESNMHHLIESAKSDQSMLKDLCLRRDSFRCVISGNIDFVSWKSGKVLLPPGKIKEPTIAAHIIPFSFAAKDNTPAAVKRTSAMFEILNRFGGIQLDELKGNEINRIQNVFTLSRNLHYFFGILQVWLDAAEGQPNTYHLRHEGALDDIPTGTLITFQSAVAGMALPDPRYIAVHAACAKVLHSSGAAEVVDQYLKDYEEVKVLSEDGSSSQFLETALRMFSVP